MDIGQVLENAIMSADLRVRSEAEQQLKNAAANHFGPYLAMLSQALGDEGNRVEVRILASLAIKNEITAKDHRTRLAQQERWLQQDQALRSDCKATALAALKSPQDRVANSAAQLIAAIAEVELPHQQWPELPELLIASTRADETAQVKRAALLAIGYICENADPHNPNLALQMDGLLTAIIQGAHSSEQNGAVRVTAINALVNSLEFIRLNFGRQNERDYIMQVVCEATQSPDAEIQSAAFGALGRIMAIYYPYMQPYMEQALFSLTVAGMCSENQVVASMAVEFWSTVCEEEIELVLEQEQEQTEGQETRINYGFARIALPQVLSTLLELLTHQNENQDEDEWNISMAAGACLQLFAQSTRDEIVQPTLEFISSHIQSTNWSHREAAIMAFGSILDGPDPMQLRGLISSALHPLLALMSDTSVNVKDTVAWCLGRIAYLVIEAIDLEKDLPAMIQALIAGLKDEPKVSTNCCWCIINLSEQLAAIPQPQTGPMSPYYPPLASVLLECSARADNEHSARTSAYEALTTMVIYSSEDVQPLVMELSSAIMERLHATVKMQSQILNTDDRTNIEELQISLLGVLTSIIRRAGNAVSSAADQLLFMFLHFLENRLPNSLIDEDIFIGIGAVAGVIGSEFGRFASAFVPFLEQALKHPEYQAVSSAVGLIADMAHALGPEMQQYAQVFLPELITILQSSDVRREIKPVALSCVGDIASSLGTEFGPYLATVSQILDQGQQLQIAADAAFDTIEYILNLREAILDAYVGIVAGLRDHQEMLRPMVPQILAFIHQVCNENELIKNEQALRSVVGMIGDIASMYPDKSFRSTFAEDWVTAVLKRAKDRTLASTTRDTARWAREQQKMQIA